MPGDRAEGLGRGQPDQQGQGQVHVPDPITGHQARARGPAHPPWDGVPVPTPQARSARPSRYRAAQAARSRLRSRLLLAHAPLSPRSGPPEDERRVLGTETSRQRCARKATRQDAQETGLAGACRLGVLDKRQGPTPAAAWVVPRSVSEYQPSEVVSRCQQIT